jgi:hypothetical protein
MRSYKATITAALAVVALTPGLAEASSQQEAMAKSSQLSQLVQAKMAQNPSEGQSMLIKMQPIMQANQAKMTTGGTVDLDAVCVQYDALIKQAQ